MHNSTIARWEIEYSERDEPWEEGAKAGINSDGGKAKSVPG